MGPNDGLLVFTERLLFQCPNLESIHATGCVDSLCEVIETQVGHFIMKILRLFILVLFHHFDHEAKD